MTQTNTAARGNLSHRSGSSRKLLARKALSTVPAPGGDALEDVFPVGDEHAEPDTGASVAVQEPATADIGTDDTAAEATVAPVVTDAQTIGASEPADALSELMLPDQAPALPPAPAWSEEDEATFQSMTARRKAAGFQPRGREVGGQLLRAGDIAPAPGTVVAALVALVAERGPVRRGEMVTSIFAAPPFYPKARADASWIQAYLQGGVRDGFSRSRPLPILQR